MAKGDEAETTLEFAKEKETKNTIKFQEVEREGEAKVIGALYVQKWWAKDANGFILSMIKK